MQVLHQVMQKGVEIPPSAIVLEAWSLKYKSVTTFSTMEFT